jgi:hypothetical protein
MTASAKAICSHNTDINKTEMLIFNSDSEKEITSNNSDI